MGPSFSTGTKWGLNGSAFENFNRDPMGFWNPPYAVPNNFGVHFEVVSPKIIVVNINRG